MRETMLMLDESEKSTVNMDAPERPGSESRNMKPDMCLKKEYDEEQEEFCGDDGCDKDTKDEGKQEQSSSDKEDESKWTDEEAMDWSDDEEDSIASTEQTELWEFFLNNDPHNPFYSSCTTGFKTNCAETQQQNCATSTPSSVKRSRSGDVEQSPEKNINIGPSRRVRFNEEVTVHPLECDSATQAARDGSCWMQLATDRLRFRRRVEIIGKIISPFLTAQHRAKVWARLQGKAEPGTQD